MTAAAAHIIEDFEALPEPEKRQVLAKLLQIARHMDYGAISDLGCFGGRLVCFVRSRGTV